MYGVCIWVGVILEMGFVSSLIWIYWKFYKGYSVEVRFWECNMLVWLIGSFMNRFFCIG